MANSWSHTFGGRSEKGAGVGVRPLFTAPRRWQATLGLHSFLLARQTLFWLLLWPPFRWLFGHLLQLSLLELLSWQHSRHLLQLLLLRLLWTFS